MNLEHDLRRAFRRKPAPPDFADRVLARLARREAVPVTPLSSASRPPTVRWLSAAAIAAVVIGGTQYYSHQQRVVEAERVQQEVRLALQIAAEKVALVQRRLQGPPR